MADALTQIVEKLEENSNILVTVNTNPTVDELSAALGITLLLNKLDKHATAVFSGHVPPALEFLQPEKPVEGTGQQIEPMHLRAMGGFCTTLS